jgi:hypothetical protein
VSTPVKPGSVEAGSVAPGSVKAGSVEPGSVQPGPGAPVLPVGPAASPAGPVPVIAADSRFNDERRVLRRATRQQTAELLAWLGYIAVVATGIAWHEAWADEAQAWLLARDNGFWHLMLHAVRYEGSPGLWHALLWGLVRLHVGYVGMHWVSGAIAAAGVYVFLRWSPFPLVLRILLPFGFWLAYQDAVVARSYVLYAVLAFSAAAILRRISQRDHSAPIRWPALTGLAVLLGLMANISVHGFVASLGFAIVGWVLAGRFPSGRRADWVIPAVLLGCFWVFAVVTTFPPSDVDFPAGKNLERSIDKIEAGFGSQQAKAELRASKSTTSEVRPGELTPIPPLQYHRTARQALWHKVGRVLSLFTYPVSNFRWLALAACILVVIQAIVFRAGPGQLGWIGLVPWLLMVLVFTSMYMAPRHAGMLWESLLAALWLTWPSQPPSRGPLRWLHGIVMAGLVLVAGDQIWWTAHAVWGDVHGPYSGDAAMAKFLKAEGSGKRIAGFYYHSVGVAAYFAGPIYFNQPAAYWIWSRNQRSVQTAPAAIATHPDMLVVGGWDWSPQNGNIVDDWIPADPDKVNLVPMNDAYQIVPYAEAHGYRETHRFCGHAFIRAGYAEQLCQAALEPVPQPAVEAVPQPAPPTVPQPGSH